MKTAYINCTILDGSKNMKPIQNSTILVDGEKIKSVSQEVIDTSGYEIIDLKGKYLMPGLINLHVHLPSTGKPKKKQGNPATLAKLLMSNPLTRLAARKFCQDNALVQLLSGVTTIRTVGGVGTIDTEIRDLINQGKIIGPRILAANMAITVPGGHMAGSVAYPAESIEEAVEYVRQVAATNPDLIKLMITGGVMDATVKGEPGQLKMPPEYVKACCDEAHKLGFHVAAHVESTEGIRVALENGVDTIEHGAPLTHDLVDLFKKRNAKLISTISPALPYAMFDREITHISEDTQYNGKVVMDGIIDCAKVALKNDIPVGLGTDTGCPFITHYDMWRELNYYVKYLEVSNAFALYSATALNAKIAGLENVGEIKKGYSADFLITENNPLESFTALRQPSMVVVRGQRNPAKKLAKFLKVEAALDRWL